MKNLITTLVEVAGGALVAVGVGLYNLPAGLISAGVLCLAFGWLGGRE